jgi:hypothetical protein
LVKAAGSTRHVEFACRIIPCFRTVRFCIGAQPSGGRKPDAVRLAACPGYSACAQLPLPRKHKGPRAVAAARLAVTRLWPAQRRSR